MPHSFTEHDDTLSVETSETGRGEAHNSQRDGYVLDSEKAFQLEQATSQEDSSSEEIVMLDDMFSSPEPDESSALVEQFIRNHKRLQEEINDALEQNKVLQERGENLAELGAKVVKAARRQRSDIKVVNDRLEANQQNFQKAMPKVWYKSVSVWLGASALVLGVAALSVSLFFPPAMALAAYLMPTGVGLLAASGLIGLIKGVRTQLKKPFLLQVSTIESKSSEQVEQAFDDARREFTQAAPAALAVALSSVKDDYHGRQQPASPAKLVAAQRDRAAATRSGSNDSDCASESEDDAFIPTF